MKEILQALESRIKNPLFGYFVLAFLGFNWKPIYYLIVDKDASLKIFYFNNNTDSFSLFLYPLLWAIIFSVLYPWINYWFLLVTAKPTDMRNTLNAQTEHNLLIKKQQLERLRADMLSDAEANIINRAKRDEELNNIQNEEIRTRVKEEIAKLRYAGVSLEQFQDGLPKELDGISPDQDYDSAFTLATWSDVINERILDLKDGEKTPFKKLVPQWEWMKMPEMNRKLLGKQFKKLVDRGDFVGLVAVPEKTSSNEQLYVKSLGSAGS